jgi:hypothetical protein
LTSSPEDSSARPRAAVRLILAYVGEDVTLVSQSRLTMTIPPGDDPGAAGDAQGFWVEVRRADGQVLDRRVMAHPVRHDAEVFSDDPRQTLGRVRVDKPQGAFTIVVPDHSVAVHVALVLSEPDEAAGQPGTAPGPRRREIARFALPRAGNGQGER